MRRVTLTAAFFMVSYLSIINERFLLTHLRSIKFIQEIPEDQLYDRPEQNGIDLQPLSPGENILRSAGSVEQTFGGITTRLWDDPFEWTLPEKLFQPEYILEYLNEVEETRIRGFAFIDSDENLIKQIPSPVKIRPILDVLIETLATAEHYQGRAFGLLEAFNRKKLRYN